MDNQSSSPPSPPTGAPGNTTPVATTGTSTPPLFNQVQTQVDGNPVMPGQMMPGGMPMPETTPVSAHQAFLINSQMHSFVPATMPNMSGMVPQYGNQMTMQYAAGMVTPGVGESASLTVNLSDPDSLRAHLELLQQHFSNQQQTMLQAITQQAQANTAVLLAAAMTAGSDSPPNQPAAGVSSTSAEPAPVSTTTESFAAVANTESTSDRHVAIPTPEPAAAPARVYYDKRYPPKQYFTCSVTGQTAEVVPKKQRRYYKQGKYQYKPIPRKPRAPAACKRELTTEEKIAMIMEYHALPNSFLAENHLASSTMQLWQRQYEYLTKTGINCFELSKGRPRYFEMFVFTPLLEEFISDAVASQSASASESAVGPSTVDMAEGAASSDVGASSTAELAAVTAVTTSGTTAADAITEEELMIIDDPTPLQGITMTTAQLRQMCFEAARRTADVRNFVYPDVMKIRGHAIDKKTLAKYYEIAKAAVEGRGVTVVEGEAEEEVLEVFDDEEIEIEDIDIDGDGGGGEGDD